MEISKGVELIDGLPVVYIEAIDALVVSDLHLGYEVVAAEQGITLPRTQTGELKKQIEKAHKIHPAKNIIIDGDLKHEFSETSYHEFGEVFDFLDFLSKKFSKVVVLKGNHDTFMWRVTRRFENVELLDTFEQGDFFFAHGHQDLDLKRIGASWVIIGNEHPSLALVDELGIKAKVRAAIFGGIGRKKVLVLPAMSIFAPGTDINMCDKSHLLCPILKKHGVDNFEAIGIIEGEESLRFPKISRLRTPG